jgi:UDP-2,4-diacetamido-2,4,6-trideoxy-beta-L-altropyranose hydrolase
MKAKCFFRVDCSVEVGTGHLMRSITLANSLRAYGYDSVFVLPSTSPIAVLEQLDCKYQLIAELSCEEDAKSFLRIIDSVNNSVEERCVVVDHYGLDSAWEVLVKPHCARLMAIDDIAREHVADIVLDQNEYQDKTRRYEGKVPETSQLLLGSRYALLKEAFFKCERRDRSRLQRVLVNFGGSDPAGITMPVLQALVSSNIYDINVDVVVGALQPDLDDVVAFCEGQPTWAVHVQTNDMPRLMERADLCLGASGTTTWERCSVGLPSVMVTVADNQRELADSVASTGAALCVGDANSLGKEVAAAKIVSALETLHEFPALLRSMSNNAKQLCDGRGAKRVVAALLRHEIEFRKAQEADASQLWQWRYSDDVNSFSGDGTVPSYEQHIEWLSKVLVDSSRVLWIVELNDLPIAVVRCDELTSEQATISIYLTPNHGGYGWGNLILNRVSESLRSPEYTCEKILAEIHPDNVSSQKSFSAAGYQQRNQTWVLEL